MQLMTEFGGRVYTKTKSAAHPGLRPGLLLVTDDLSRAEKLERMFNNSLIEIAWTDSLSALEPLLHGKYRLVIIDLAPANLLRALDSIREKPACQAMPILVESSRLLANSGFGVHLSRYRAMPCCINDLPTLARFYLECESEKPRSNSIL